MKPGPLSRDRHALYEASVQGVEQDLDLFERVFRSLRGREFHDLREDFCGTAQLACAWVMRGRDRRAWGVDLDPEPLAWARRHHFPSMRTAATRVTLLRRDVRAVTRPRVDAICAMNFSWWVFHERRELVRYFRTVRRSLRPGGLFFANAFGGTEAMETLVERRRIQVSNAADGTLLPAFAYEWEHAHFNPIDHRLRCHIHFKFRDGRRMRRAFSYDWRLWTLPEIREALAEAGFADCAFYIEGWDPKTGAGNGVYRRRVHFENQEGWLAVVTGIA
jgi:SAM-dependent methyltransferase